MSTDLITATLKLEGELFKLGRKLDSCVNLHEYVNLRKEQSHTMVKLEQYRCCIDELQKQATIKRRMRR